MITSLDCQYWIQPKRKAIGSEQIPTSDFRVPTSNIGVNVPLCLGYREVLPRAESQMPAAEPTLVDEPQREHVGVEPLGQQRMRANFRAKTVPRPEPAPLAIEQRVAPALKRELLRQDEDLIPLVAKPALKKAFLTLGVRDNKTATGQPGRRGPGQRWP